MNYIFLLLIPIRALLYRFRGGAISLGPNRTDEARLLFHVLPDAITIAILCLIQGLPFWLIPISTLLSFVTICIGDSKYETNTIIAYLGMTLILVLRVTSIYAPLAIYTMNWHYMIPVIVMLLTFPLCWLSYEPFMQRKLTIIIPLIYTIPSSEPEELLIGSVIGLVSALEFIL